MLDLIPSQVLGAGSGFSYLQDSWDFDTADFVDEGEIKPQADLGLEDAEVTVQVIAHWLKLLRPQLADVPALGTTAQTRLTYRLMLKLENSVLAGPGGARRIRGILATEGIQDVPYAAGPLSDLALDGIVAVELGLADANGVVVYPTDWSQMLRAITDRDGGRWMAPVPLGSSPRPCGGCPVYGIPQSSRAPPLSVTSARRSCGPGRR